VCSSEMVKRIVTLWRRIRSIFTMKIMLIIAYQRYLSPPPDCYAYHHLLHQGIIRYIYIGTGLTLVSQKSYMNIYHFLLFFQVLSIFEFILYSLFFLLQSWCLASVYSLLINILRMNVFSYNYVY
jgi:hypothetical protein